MQTRIAMIAAAIFMAGCASSPDKIPVAYVSPDKYESYSCEQIDREMGYIGQRNSKLYRDLKKDADGDKMQMGVGLVLFWPVLFALEGGDGPQAEEYSRLRGEYEVLRQTAVRKNCTPRSKSAEQLIREHEAAMRESKKRKPRDER